MVQYRDLQKNVKLLTRDILTSNYDSVMDSYEKFEEYKRDSSYPGQNSRFHDTEHVLADILQAVIYLSNVAIKNTYSFDHVTKAYKFVKDQNWITTEGNRATGVTSEGLEIAKKYSKIHGLELPKNYY